MCKGDILGQEMTFLLSCYSTRYRPLAKWDTAQMSWATHSRWRDPAVPSLPFEDVAKISATYCLTMTITTTGNTNPHFPNIPTYPGLNDNKTNTTSVFQPCFTTLFTQPPPFSLPCVLSQLPQDFPKDYDDSCIYYWKTLMWPDVFFGTPMFHCTFFCHENQPIQ